ncbi:YtxH domain-containing protein [Paenibacillus eucommiae]|uniref:Gas vesicle protein n=1 Tax=Paenibacillus eucommiae TaxID=1355755 RepID=A0ABS4IP36_9BACL|nr:YtxH domain-containing protein [Paenibacillus eucommiae]MBP1989314.1 gas vesicle protein [Paenibacillus eucommiae]
MTDQQKGKNLLLGAVIGGVLGAITALLTAPKSGRELRSDIAGQVSAVTEKTQQAASVINEKTQELVQSVRSWRKSEPVDVKETEESEEFELIDDLIVLNDRKASSN